MSQVWWWDITKLTGPAKWTCFYLYVIIDMTQDSCVAAAFVGRSPDLKDLRGFRLHLASSGAGARKINATVSALRFFFNVTPDRPTSPSTWRSCTSHARCRWC